MKYEVGDEIVVLHTNEEGKVIEIISDKMVMIEVRGVKFPTYTEQIDFPYFKRFTQKKRIFQEKKEKKFADTIPKEKLKPGQVKASEGVWLSLLPKFASDELGDEVVELLKLYLVNRTGKSYKFIYKQQFSGRTNFDLINEVIAFQDFYLHDISFADFNDNPTFFFEFSLVTPDKTKAEFFETSLKLRGKQIFQRIEQMKQKNEPTISFELFETYPAPSQQEKAELSANAKGGNFSYKPKKSTYQPEPARSVIDLHIEKLKEDWRNMSNFEILTLQLKEFEKWYQLAVAHEQPNLVVIHGVGSGKLRDEIHELLKAKREVRFFINQYDHRFGYGATEIFFQY